MDTEGNGAAVAEPEAPAGAADDLIVEHEGTRRMGLPDAATQALQGKVTEPGVVEIDATNWILATDMDGDAPEEVEPTRIRLTLSRAGGVTRKVEWHVIPLDPDSFRRFRKMASGSNRAQRRASVQQQVAEIDDAVYHRLVVTAATVHPNLRAAAAQKGIADPSEIVKHRFALKPGLVAQISGVVSDISGYDEDDLEVMAGNS